MSAGKEYELFIIPLAVPYIFIKNLCQIDLVNSFA